MDNGTCKYKKKKKKTKVKTSTKSVSPPPQEEGDDTMLYAIIGAAALAAGYIIYKK